MHRPMTFCKLGGQYSGKGEIIICDPKINKGLQAKGEDRLVRKEEPVE